MTTFFIKTIGDNPIIFSSYKLQIMKSETNFIKRLAKKENRKDLIDIYFDLQTKGRIYNEVIKN